MANEQNVRNGIARIAHSAATAGSPGNTRFSRKSGKAGCHASGLSADILPPRVPRLAHKAGRRVSPKPGIPTPRQPRPERPSAPTRRKKAIRSPHFPVLPPCGEILCGRKFPSLRQATNFFAERNSILCAQKRRIWRRNVSYRHFHGFHFNNCPFFRHSSVRPRIKGIREKLSFCQ